MWRALSEAPPSRLYLFPCTSIPLRCLDLTCVDQQKDATSPSSTTCRDDRAFHRHALDLVSHRRVSARVGFGQEQGARSRGPLPDPSRHLRSVDDSRLWFLSASRLETLPAEIWLLILREEGIFGTEMGYHYWTTPGNHIGFVVMYAFTFFFANFGPNSTTFIVPAEVFPAQTSAAEVDMPRDIGSDREDGGDRGGLRVPVPGVEPGPSEGGPRLPCRDRGEECPLLACRVQSSRASVHLPGAGVEGKVARGNDRRERGDSGR
ncbi:hypothetical protein ZIOFF_024038 [Zingiber officinale]|uniref:Uncharacterized protein n=1 Tax=Zingiber officinale TaxID=94328 RepID=A0A8J5GVN5_ZINOF|nr:hypothetical protein ZIOFF_024038 [Zingiber officinale]